MIGSSRSITTRRSCLELYSHHVEKRNFDDEARTWDSNPTRLNLALSLADAIAQALVLQGNEVMLDYGAGTGIVALKLSPRVSEVVCADSSEGMLAVIEEKLRTVPEARIKTRRLDLEHEQADFKVDVVTSTMTLHHVADTQALFNAFFAMLKPGGQIALADLDTEPGDFHPDNTGVQHFGFERELLRQKLSTAGFIDLNVSTAYTIAKEKPEGSRNYPVFLFTGRKAG